MINLSGGRHFGLTLVLILGLMAAAGGLTFLPVSHSSEWELISSLSEIRIGEGRLFRASTAPYDERRHKKALAEAQLLVFSTSDSPVRQRLQALIAAGTGQLGVATEILRDLSEANPADAEILNDLGVLYMAAGRTDASNYFKAARLFERAAQLAALAPAPRFNAVIAYRLANLPDLAQRGLIEYKQRENNAYWISGLRQDPPTESQLLIRLRQARNDADMVNAESIVRRNVLTFRKAVMEEALNPPDSPDLEALDTILKYSAMEHTDNTAQALLAPLRETKPQAIINVRRLVHQGIEAYKQGSFESSSHFYELAEKAAENSDSIVDTLWIKLNKADVALRTGGTSQARALLEDVIARSTELDYKWFLGKALAAKGADPTLIADNEQALATLTEAVNILTMAGAPQDTGRPLYYRAAIHSLAGDFDTSLQLSFEALRVTPNNETVRRAQLFWLAGLQLYRLGYADYARDFEEQAIRQANLARNPGLVVFFSAYVAMIDAQQRNYGAAERTLSVARNMIGELESAREQELDKLALNLICGRVMIDTGRLSTGEECLQENLKILGKFPAPLPYYVAQTLLQSAEIHALQKKFKLTHQELRRATKVVETQDVYFAANALRTAFENERRNFYDQAVTFEHQQGATDAAWEYVQGYRSKLFLEFLGQMNSGVSSVHNNAIDRGKVQRLIPSDVQVVEYVMLEERLLIWLISKNTFRVATVPITRSAIERKVSGFLKRVQDKGDFLQEAAGLHRILIEPIEDQLDPKLALAIIPDQGLHRLNFPALYSISKKSYLVERYAILENPSLTSLLSAPSDVPMRNSAVAFGAQSDDTNATTELNGLRKYYANIQTFDAQAAVKPAFLSSMVQAGVFHYAGHSQDASDPLKSSVLLDGKTEGPNSVSAVDITKRRMPPNSVVVLASCDSSVGNSRDGIGIRGLTSAFLISGAGSVVGSLWLVESDSTSRLVLEFHKSFAKDKLSVAEALRKAQMRFITDGVHPYYWSGFVVTGNVSALQ